MFGREKLRGWGGMAVGVLALGAALVGARRSESADASAPAGRQLTPPGYVFDPDIPHDIVTQDVGAIGFQPFVDNLGWYSFIGLNWPVPNPIVQRGVPDRQNVTGGLVQGGEGGGTTSPNGPTVWETFKDTDDIYLNPPIKPTPFDAPEIIPPACRGLAKADPVAARRTLIQVAKVSDVLKDYRQAFTGYPLIDQNGQKVWYEVKVNRVYYDYVVNHGFYNSNNQVGKTIFFPFGSNTTDVEPTIKVKAAWKVMGQLGSKQPDDPKKFYTTMALVLDPVSGKCSKQLMGLVGLHVVVKTKQLPQWMWATFEQADNAPDQSTGPVAGKKYNFYNPACPTCPVNAPPTSISSTTPTQVMRVVPVSSTSPNDTFQAALSSLRVGNVWSNYMLVNAQWAGKRLPLGVPSQPQYLANTTLETYLQQPVDDPQAPHGCINCHGTYADKTDLDFQLQKAYPHAKTAARDILRSHGAKTPPKK